MTIQQALLGGGDPTPVSLTVSSSVASYDAFVAAGSPSYAAVVVVTINAGVEIGHPVGAHTTPAPSFLTGSWPVGSRMTIVNNGRIFGCGGKGGNGATAVPSSSVNGANGVAGSDAMSLGMDVTIDNTSGEIFGGGGGGGGGGAGNNLSFAGGGGGGGGGQGSGVSNLGSGGVGLNAPAENGGAGTSGSTAAAGSGGSGGASATPGGSGNSGGGWGVAGGSGASGAGPGGGGGSGGAAGKAINLNGFTATFTGGNNPAQVKGVVS